MSPCFHFLLFFCVFLLCLGGGGGGWEGMRDLLFSLRNLK